MQVRAEILSQTTSLQAIPQHEGVFSRVSSSKGTNKTHHKSYLWKEVICDMLVVVVCTIPPKPNTYVEI
eukprot:1937326-Amphidinium_carterae.1